MTDAAVRVVEVGPRDGLQNEATVLDPETRVAFIDRLIDSGHRRIESVSFVHPTRVPQMADAETVMERVARHGPDGQPVSHIALVLNERGARRAVDAGVDEMNVVVVASDEFSRRNQGVGVDEMLDVAATCVDHARTAGISTTITIAAAFGCPFRGDVPIDDVVRVARRAAELGVDEVALADTIGVGVPADVRSRFEAVGSLGSFRLRAHFHNTRNTGYANALAAVETGVTAIDAAAGGFGGCPFAPAATGNIATEDTLYLLRRSGVRLVDAPSHDAAVADGVWIAERLGASAAPALLGRAGDFPAG